MAEDWAAFASTGLLHELRESGLIVAHEDAALDLAARPGAAAVIRPRELPFISYPYEWCFSQLREAALLTLELQRRALARGMRLKDASAYNIGWEAGRPILIDSLSFERADLAEPWPAYRQFCEHFVAPLALIAFRDARLGLLSRDFIDGVPLDLAARLLPRRTLLRGGLLAHLHLHARAQARGAASADPGRAPRRMSGLGQQALLDNLRRTIEGVHWAPRQGHWVDYGTLTSYSEQAAASKRDTVRRLLERTPDGPVWDVGANVGTYSGVAADLGRSVLAFDMDAASVEQHWRTLDANRRARIMPLVADLANPSPAMGWDLAERRSLVARGPAASVLALALIHHLAIGNNVPFGRISAFFARIAPHLVIEFVPKEDPMVGRLLAARRDVFDDYTIEGFRAAFGNDFRITDEVRVEDSLRTIFLLEARAPG